MEELVENWQAVADTLKDGLIVINLQGEIISVNKAMEKLTGYDAEEMLGQSCRIFNCSGCKIIGKGSGDQWCKLFTIGKSRDKKCQITRKNKEVVKILKSATLLRNKEGKAVGEWEFF